jgi:hypothetical protein
MRHIDGCVRFYFAVEPRSLGQELLRFPAGLSSGRVEVGGAVVNRVRLAEVELKLFEVPRSELGDFGIFDRINRIGSGLGWG